MTIYFNEIDPFASRWLANLFPGQTVDTRSIADVEISAVRSARRAHFFAGIGGWEYALQLSGWPDERPVWTGSCPCQPFSSAGKRKGAADERHLWPEFFRLISECRPAIIFGEQVASSDGLRWLDGVCADLEGAGYACGAADLCAAGVGAPHIRQRLFWVAYAGHRGTGAGHGRTRFETSCKRRVACDDNSAGGMVDRLADSASSGRGPATAATTENGIAPQWSPRPELHRELPDGPEGRSAHPGGLGDANSERQNPVGGIREGERTDAERSFGGVGDAASDNEQRLRQQGSRNGWAGTIGGSSPWSDHRIIPCLDGKSRRISSQRGDEPLVAGIPRDVGQRVPELRELAKGARGNRVGRLRGYGNAIIPQVAAVFVRAVMDWLNSDGTES